MQGGGRLRVSGQPAQKCTNGCRRRRSLRSRERVVTSFGGQTFAEGGDQLAALELILNQCGVPDQHPLPPTAASNAMAYNVKCSPRQRFGSGVPVQVSHAAQSASQ